MLEYSDEEADMQTLPTGVQVVKDPLCPRTDDGLAPLSTSSVILSGAPALHPMFGLTNKSIHVDGQRDKNFLSRGTDQSRGPRVEAEPTLQGQGALGKLRSEKRPDNNPDSFFMSMKTAVLLAQYLGILPVSGSHGFNYREIKFTWFHYKTVYWAASLLGTFFYFVCYLRYSILTGTYTNGASRIIFFVSAILSSFSILHLAYNWGVLNGEFGAVERRLMKYGYPKGMGLKFKAITIGFIFFSLVEFLLSKVTFFDDMSWNKDGSDIFGTVDSFFVENYKEVFEFYPYNMFAGFVIFASNFTTSIVWTFQDLFLGFVSCSIAERFKQINSSLQRVHGQGMPLGFWKEIREDYNSLALLTKRVDTFTQKIMFLAIGNDLFLLCMTLFKSLQNDISSLMLLYFIWSFGFQLVKTIFVIFTAAQINDESKEPKAVLYSVPQSNYSAEVRRFLTQLTTNDVALTGCGFFSVTRSLLLTIMGTLITYEIVLVQFNNKNDILESRNYTCLP